MSYEIDSVTEDTTCFICEGKIKQLPNNIVGQKIIDYYPNWFKC